MTQHKWHDEIVAWAGGSEIEFQYPAQDLKWENWGDNPDWSNTDYNYRIKPQPKEKKYLYVYHKNGLPVDISPVKWLSYQGYEYLGKIEVLDD